MRKSEKDRDSSCEFANIIASIVLNEYNKIPSQIRQRYKQTVLAAIVAVENCNNNMKYEVISMGIGTKTLPISVYLNERKAYSNNTNNRVASKLIRDCHAEILARRG